MSARLGTTAGGSFGDDAANAKTNATISLGADANLTNNPSFDLIVLNNTQEFYNGIISPIEPSVINFFYEKGRDIKEVLNLFVDRIELNVKHRCKLNGASSYSPKCEFDNYPLDQPDHLDFLCVAGFLKDVGFRIEPYVNTAPLDFKLPLDKLGNVQQITTAFKEGARFGKGATDVPLSIEIGRDARFAFADAPQPDAPPNGTKRDGRARATAKPEADEIGIKATPLFTYDDLDRLFPDPTLRPDQRRARLPFSVYGKPREVDVIEACVPLIKEVFFHPAERVPGRPAPAPLTLDGTIVLQRRSTEEVFAYVGRVACLDLGLPSCAKGQPEERLPPALLPHWLRVAEAADEGALDGERLPLAEVEYDGTRYAVPGDDAQSARTLALLSRLVAINSKAPKPPLTGAVEIVGAGRSP